MVVRFKRLVWPWLEQLVGKVRGHLDADEFERLSEKSRGTSKEWKFDRE